MTVVVVLLCLVVLALTGMVGAGGFYLGQLRAKLEADRAAAVDRQATLVKTLAEVASYVVTSDGNVGKRLVSLEALPAAIRALQQQVSILQSQQARAAAPKEESGKPHPLQAGEMPRFDTDAPMVAGRLTTPAKPPEKKQGAQQ